MLRRPYWAVKQEKSIAVRDKSAILPATARRESTMTNRNTRREILKGSLALAGLGIIGLPAWVSPVVAPRESLVSMRRWSAELNSQ